MLSYRNCQTFSLVESQKVSIYELHQLVEWSGIHVFKVKLLEYLPSVNLNIVDEIIEFSTGLA
jgi:hypothetical protein